MAVEDREPCVFIQDTTDHIDDLVKAIKFYREQK